MSTCPKHTKSANTPNFKQNWQTRQMQHKFSLLSTPAMSHLVIPHTLTPARKHWMAQMLQQRGRHHTTDLQWPRPQLNYCHLRASTTVQIYPNWGGGAGGCVQAWESTGFVTAAARRRTSAPDFLLDGTASSSPSRKQPRPCLLGVTGIAGLRHPGRAGWVQVACSHSAPARGRCGAGRAFKWYQRILRGSPFFWRGRLRDRGCHGGCESGWCGSVEKLFFDTVVLPLPVPPPPPHLMVCIVCFVWG